ncbi:MAG: DHH family phosphoesterase [Lachnospiraceae bacterium]|nr:DHH family phosphoesterase [Lachnospiraceae bacterium]
MEAGMRLTRFKIYLLFPLIATVILLLDAAVLGFGVKDKRAAGIMMIGVLLYIIVLVIAAVLIRQRLKHDLVKVGVGYSVVQREMISLLAVPYAVMDTNARILWTNYEMQDLLSEIKGRPDSMTALFPNITKSKMPTATADVVFHAEIGNKSYKVILSAMEAPKFDESLNIINEVEGDMNSKLISVYLYDETEISVLRQENYNQQMIIGLLYIDNYDEVLEVVDEVKRSLLSALVDRKINKYMNTMSAVIKKLEKDKYLFVFQKKYLEEVKQTGKVLLEEVKKINSGKTESNITISMGLGIAESDYAKSYEYARAAIDLALGRGGDQIVIKNGDDITYIGGKSASIEKSNRVTARVKAHALRELIEAHDEVIIMGHSISDADALGSAIGVYSIARALGKNAHIVLNEINAAIRPIASRFLDNPDYPSDMFVGSLTAQEKAGKDGLLIVCDVNRPTRTECPELFNLIPTVILLDHHRVTEDSIKHAVLSYVEPYASSASEMVAEVLQYIGSELKLRPLEAEALYAGIMIDTNNFLTKTGVRTFEAAAYLRKNGVDVTSIRKAFRADMNEYVTKARAITSTEIFLDGFAFAKCLTDGIESPTVLGAQVANELLEIVGIRASFVFTEYQNKIYVSARSIDEINVQVIMEKLGGGGHMNVAGAQIEDVSIDQAMDMVRTVLYNMKTGGEL